MFESPKVSTVVTDARRTDCRACHACVLCFITPTPDIEFMDLMMLLHATG